MDRLTVLLKDIASLGNGSPPVFSPGTSVRIKSDPGRIGVVLDKTRSLGADIYQQVRFPDGTQFLRPSQIEQISDENEDPLDLLRDGKFGRARDLRGLLTHVRLSGRLANLIYSMDTTNTDFYPYQFKPVLNFLDSPSGGLLIADEVGLGKTIEAGLIWTELRSRFDARKLLIVCPAVLREKWREELFNRFGIDAEIVNAEETWKRLSDVRDGRRADIHLIGSLQGLAPRRGWSEDESSLDGRTKLARLIAEAQFDDALLDLVIVDEAHYLRNPETMGAALGRLLRRVSEHMILLSATPVHLRSNDLFQLLNLVDEDTFNEASVFDEILEANAPLLKARDLVLSGPQYSVGVSELLDEASRHPFLENNRQLADIRATLEVEAAIEPESRAQLANRLERLNLLGHAVTRTRKRDVTEWRVLREAVAETVSLLPVEREFYDRVTGLVREYCARRDAHEGFLLVTPQRQVSSSMAAALRDWQLRAELADEDLEDFLERDDDVANQRGPLVSELLRNVRRLGTFEELYAADSKYRRLSSMIGEYFLNQPKEKIVLFSTFKATLRYLNERLTRDGIDCIVLMGGMREAKHEVIDRFRNAPKSCVLLASEVASEGVDLQFSRLLINYDMPWNPMKVEQRIGRIDRIGQKSPKITIWNMLHSDTIDERIYSRLYKRLGVFERALGGLEAILGDEIRKLTMDLMHGAISPDQESARIEQTLTAVANIQKIETDLEDQATNLVAHGDYILRQVNAAREMNRWITGEDLRNYVLDFFNTHYAGCEFRQKRADGLEFDIRLNETARFDFEQFIGRHKLQGQTRLGSPSAGPATCEFKNRVSAARRTKVECISQFHPLVRFVSFGILERGEKYHPNVSARLPHAQAAGLARGDYAFVVDYWSLNGLKVTERINYVVTPLDSSTDFLDAEESERLVAGAALRGSDWMAAGTQVDLVAARIAAESCLSRSIADYEGFVQQMENENQDRADLQLSSLSRHSNRQLIQLQEVLALHRSKGRAPLVKATEGRIRKLRERTKRKTDEIESNRKIVHYQRDLCVGVIRVE